MEGILFQSYQRNPPVLELWSQVTCLINGHKATCTCRLSPHFLIYHKCSPSKGILNVFQFTFFVEAAQQLIFEGFFNPTALTKAKIAYNFGLSEGNRVK